MNHGDCCARIAQIAALCDEIDSDISLQGSRDEGLVSTEDIRAVLDAPSVSAARAGGIDRDALLDLFSDDPRIGKPEVMVDRVLALVQPALDVAAPVWAFTPEGHDDEYEYVVTTDCDGQYPNTFRRTPKRVVPVGEWESIPNLPPKEQRRSVYSGEGVRS